MAATDGDHSSWALPVGVARIGPEDSHHAVAVTRIRALLDRLPTDPQRTPIVCPDGDHSPSWIGREPAGLPVRMLVRIRSDSVLLGDPPPRRAGALGRPPVHGPAMRLSDPGTWPAPDGVRIEPARPEEDRDELEVSVWHGLHPRHSTKLPDPGRTPHPGAARPIVRGSVVRIRSADPTEKPMWLFWTGPEGSFDLDRVWRAYLRRFGIEHLFRFLKRHLGWIMPRVRTPEQATRWSRVVAAACAAGRGTGPGG